MLITVTFCMILISHGSVQLLLKNVVHLYMRMEPLYKTALGLYMVQFDLYADLGNTKESYATVTNASTQKNFSQL